MNVSENEVGDVGFQVPLRRVYHRDNRFSCAINAVEQQLAGRNSRPPGALKHGGYSKTVLFPWEDADEFNALHRSLQDEWEPSGALEQDAVYTILTCIWRKRRSATNATSTL